MDRAELQQLDRIAAWAWPAFETRDVDGWLWRYSGGGSKRANSVLAQGWRGADLERSIDAVERLYRKRAARPQFNVGDASDPDRLEHALERRGYEVEEPVTTMVKAVSPGAAAPADAVEAAAPSRDWMDTYLGVVSESRRVLAPRLVARVPEPRVFISGVRGGRTVSSGLGVVKDGLCVIECMATRAEARRQGGAQSVLRGIEAYAARQGARTLFLQVVTANAPAVALYSGLGFRPVMGTRYRVLARGC